MKKYRIFASYLTGWNRQTRAIVAICLFSIVYIQQQVYCCTQSGSRCKALLTVPKSQGTAVFSFNTFFISTMEPSVKNASAAKHSNGTSTPTGAKSVSNEIRNNFVSLIEVSYPQLRSTKFKFNSGNQTKSV